MSALVLELGLGPGSLYSEIVDELPDTLSYPEVEWDAEVRLGQDLCLAERAFLGARTRHMKTYFAKLFGVSEKEIDERDLPIVAIAGSGGGMQGLELYICYRILTLLTLDRIPCYAKHYRFAYRCPAEWHLTLRDLYRWCIR